MPPVDPRVALAIGLFFLTVFILSLTAFVPGLADNELWKQLSTQIITTGFLAGVVAFFYGTNKGSADKDQTISKQLDKVP